MRSGKYQSPRRKISPALWAIALLMVLGMAFGGTRAYLAHSAVTPVTNTFQAADYPNITVNVDNSVTVNEEYEVYLRAAVTVNWKSNAKYNVLAAVPEKNTDYQENPGGDWFLHTDGFYYYTKPIANGMTPPVITITEKTSKAGYTLEADVSVQAIQAIGWTDDTNAKAVVAAWGTDPELTTPPSR